MQRSIKFPLSDGNINATLPGAAQREGKALIGGPGGTITVSADNYVDQLANVTGQAEIAKAAATESLGYANQSKDSATDSVACAAESLAYAEMTGAQVLDDGYTD